MSEPPRRPIEWLPYLWQTVLFPLAPTPETRVRLRSLLLVLLVPAVLLLPWRTFHLLEPDESRYAQIPREMLERGDWVLPHLQGEPYLDKPPLMYWLTMLSYRACGVSPESARLVPALCVQLTILAVYLIGRRGLGERAAFHAAMMLSVSPMFLGVARLLLLDGLLSLCVTLSLLAGFEAVRTGRLKLGWWLAAAAASGFGFLAKGPISELLLFPPLVAFGWLGGTAARMRFRHAALFGAVVVLVNLPWYVAVYLREPAFLRHFFWDHNVMRFLQPFDHLQPVWYYAPILLVGLLPMAFVAVPYLRNVLFVGGASSRAGSFWLLAGLWCVAFFSVSGSKLPTYILPAFPPLCLALGEFAARRPVSYLHRGMLGLFAGLMLALHAVGLPWYAKERSPVGRPELIDPYLADPSTPVVTYPRSCDSVAFRLGRSDFDSVRSKNLNDLIVAMHHRPRTVILFTHRHSYEAFRDALPESLTVADAVSLKRHRGGLDKLLGDTPWGLADVAVIRPSAAVRAQGP